MSGSIPPLPNTPTWRGVRLKESTGINLLLCPFTRNECGFVRRRRIFKFRLIYDCVCVKNIGKYAEVCHTRNLSINIYPKHLGTYNFTVMGY
jgi:hypothetical protein